MTTIKVAEILTVDFWNEFISQSEAYNYDSLHSFLETYLDSDMLKDYVILKYGDIPCFNDPEIDDYRLRAGIALGEVGHALERIVSVMMASYNPLENYFTDRQMNTDTQGNSVRTGQVESKPEGEVLDEIRGTLIREHENSNVVSQGTTYDNASTNPDGSDFRNISKVIDNTKIKDTSDSSAPRKNVRSYDGYKVTTDYKDLTTDTEMGEEIVENKHGSSGIFSKQDLTQREVDLRLRNRLLPIICRMVVSVFETGVYSVD